MRLPPVDLASLTAEQKRVADAIAGGPRGGVRGPFLALLHVPELANRIQSLGEYLRYNTSFSKRLSEMAICIAAKSQEANYEWFAHAKLALAAGVPAEVLEAIRTGKRPQGLDAEQTAVYDFASQIADQHRVSDEAYAAVMKHFGARGAVELAGLVGYYALVAMTLNAHEVLPPADSTLPFRR